MGALCKFWQAFNLNGRDYAFSDMTFIMTVYQ